MQKIKVNDTVKVLSGRDRNKTGKVTQVLLNARGERYVVVEGVNVRKKHMRTNQAGEKGRILELSAPIHASKVMLVDPGTGKPTRVGTKRDGDTKKRLAKRGGNVID